MNWNKSAIKSPHKSPLLAVVGVAAAMGVGFGASIMSTAAWAEGSAVIGRVTTQGTATVGSGVTSVAVTNNVHPYFAGEQVQVAEGSEALVRFAGHGAIKALPGTTLSAESINNRIITSAEGNGVQFQFKAGTDFELQMGCYTVKPGTDVTGQDDWVAGTVVFGAEGAYVEGAQGQFIVEKAGRVSDISAGMRAAGCDVAETPVAETAVADSAEMPTAASANSMSWLWSSAVAVVATAAAAVGGDSSSGAAREQDNSPGFATTEVDSADSEATVDSKLSAIGTTTESSSNVADITRNTNSRVKNGTNSVTKTSTTVNTNSGSGTSGTVNSGSSGSKTVVATTKLPESTSGSAGNTQGSSNTPSRAPAVPSSSGKGSVALPVSPAASPTSGKSAGIK